MKIEYLNVGYIYQRKTQFAFEALKEINLQFSSNKITAIIGNSGSGKSTLVQLSNGIERPTSGAIDVDNGGWIIQASRWKRIRNLTQLRQEVGLIFQFPEYQLFEENVFKDVTFGLKNKGVTDEKVLHKKARELLTTVGLNPDILKRNPFELSGGQKRRVAIAGILAMDPKIIFFDEPACGLDPEGALAIMNILVNLKMHQDKTIVFITHDMDEVLKYAEHVIVLDKGKVLAEGEPFTIFSNNKILEQAKITPPRIISLFNNLKQEFGNVAQRPHNLPAIVKACNFWINAKLRKRKRKVVSHE